MVELEIQALAHERDGLLVEVGRLVALEGFTLARQRLVQDPHGTLLSMVVRGSWFHKRALRGALERCERLISFEIQPWKEGEERPHFAATRHLNSGYVPPPPAAPPAPAPALAATPVAAASPAVLPTTLPGVLPAVERAAVPAAIVPERSALPAPPAGAAPPAVAAPARPPVDLPPAAGLSPRPEPIAPFLATPAAPASRSPADAPTADAEAWVEPETLAADEAAVEAWLVHCEAAWPQVLPQLAELDRGVAPGAREATLELAGRQLGAWLFARDYAQDTGLALDAALERIALPALRALVEVELADGQLHLHASPLCATPGHSGCSFFSGFLDGLLKGAIDSRRLGVFPVCCASFGAGECVLAVSE